MADSVSSFWPPSQAHHASLAAQLVPLRGRPVTVRGAGGPLTVYRSGAGAPVVVVHGNAMRDGRCRVRVRHVADAGHGIHSQRTREFLAAVLPLLAAHAAR